MSKLFFAILMAAPVVSASADVAVNFVPVQNNAAPELAGFVTQDIRVLTTNDWSSSGMVLNLTAGSIYQAAGGADTPLASSVMQQFPALAFDTYVGVVDDNSSGVAGTAGDLGGSTAGWPYQFDTQGLDVTWFNMPGSFSDLDLGVTTIGRLSLSDDAQGMLAFSVSEKDKALAVYEFPVIDGHVIPDQCYGLGGDAGCNIIGINDLNNVLSHWNQSVAVGSPSLGDYDHDGFVGIDDLNAVLAFWNVESSQNTTDLVYDLSGFGDDGFIGISDLNVILGDWNRNVPPANPLADPTSDGFVGQDDLNAILSNWNAGTPPAASLPEPGSLALLGVAWAYCLRRRSE